MVPYCCGAPKRLPNQGLRFVKEELGSLLMQTCPMLVRRAGRFQIRRFVAVVWVASVRVTTFCSSFRSVFTRPFPNCIRSPDVNSKGYRFSAARRILHSTTASAHLFSMLSRKCFLGDAQCLLLTIKCGVPTFGQHFCFILSGPAVPYTSSPWTQEVPSGGRTTCLRMIFSPDRIDALVFEMY